jgi:3,4-dihydroxy 2-butanone 4-phosphate synthase/GTP cyclohydrolase II
LSAASLRGCDCDCVQQLEGAFKVIAEKGKGILFYLMQEGRGVGYVAKARDRIPLARPEDLAHYIAGLRKAGLT